MVTGVPPSRREEVWEFLSKLYLTRNQPEWDFPEELCGEVAFKQLGQMPTEYEHTITMDLGIIIA